MMVIFSKKQNNQVHLFISPHGIDKIVHFKTKKASQVRTESLGLSASDRAGWTHPQWRRPMSPMQVGSLLGRALRGGERSPFTIGLRSRQELDQVLGLRGGKPEQRLPTCMGRAQGKTHN